MAVVSQLGARMHYAVPRIFHAAGRLERLYTDICATAGWPRALAAVPAASLPAPLRRLRGRIPLSIPRERIESFEMVGLASVLSRTLDRGRAADTRAALRAGQRFSRAVARRGFGNAEMLYAMSGESLEQLEAARRRGLVTIVEQIIAPRRIVDELVEREIARHPEWSEATEPDPFAADFASRERAEWSCADLIVCPSQFVRDGISRVGGPVERCVVVPYGVDIAPLSIRETTHRSGRLRVLTAGAVGLRKGSPYVLEAARQLSSLAEFRMVGSPPASERIRRSLHDHLDLRGVVPRSEMVGHYEWADVFLLPSVCEGSATVIYEAMAYGLPIVTTLNAGSVIRHGTEGYICPAGDAEELCRRIESLACDADLRASMSSEARRRAAEHNVAAYGRRLLAAIDGVRSSQVALA